MKRKLLLIGLGISIALVVVIILTVGLIILNTNKSTTNHTVSDDPPVHFTNEIVVRIGNSSLWALDIDNGNASFIIRNTEDHFDSFDAYLKKTIYLGSSVIGEPIKSVSKMFPELRQLTGVWNSEKIVVDSLNEKVYVLDRLVPKINIFDISSEYYNVVVVDLNQPKDIALDPIKGLLFILQNSGILKINIDGSSPEILADTSGISAFSIERTETQIYWANLESIVCMPYAGQTYQIVKKIVNTVISLAVLKDNLFWINFDYEVGNTVLWSCIIRKGVCEVDPKKISIDNALEIKAYNFNPYEVSNKCYTSNCDQMCTMDQAGEPRCVCTIGWRPEGGSGSCKFISDFLIYIQGSFAKGRSLDFTKNSYFEAMLPTKLNISNKQHVINFDYEARTYTLIYNDEWSTYRQNLKIEEENHKIGGHKKFGLIMPAFDWISKNLYYINTNWIDLHYIGVTKIDSFNISTTKTIVKSYHISDFTSLIVHPNCGYLFYSIKYQKESKIFRRNLDGREEISFNHSSVSDDSNILGIDYEVDRLYWFSKNKKKLHHTTLEGLDIQTIDISIIQNPRTINVQGKYLYISNFTSIWRLDKKTGDNGIKLIPLIGDVSQPIYGAKIFSNKKQLINKDHPCAVSNGGCARYCFGVPRTNGELLGKIRLKKECDCGDDEILAPDGMNCINRWSHFQ